MTTLNEQVRYIDQYLKSVVKNNSKCAKCIYNHFGICFFAYQCVGNDFNFYKTDSPTVDAVEMVRCENCKHYDEQVWDKIGRGRCKSQNIDMFPNDYCAYGERREE